jgi:triphosphoribosyl-dephospho-CoA synthase
MAQLQDTNLLHRGGPEGLAFVQNAARRFLEAGGVHSRDWRQRALDLHGDCVALHLSPGGAADCLAAAWFVHGLAA